MFLSLYFLKATHTVFSAVLRGGSPGSLDLSNEKWAMMRRPSI